MIRSVHNLLVRIFNLYPPTPPPLISDPPSFNSGKLTSGNVQTEAEKDLDVVFSAVGKTVTEGLTAFDKATTASPAGELLLK